MIVTIYYVTRFENDKAVETVSHSWRTLESAEKYAAQIRKYKHCKGHDIRVTVHELEVEDDLPEGMVDHDEEDRRAYQEELIEQRHIRPSDY